MGNAIITRTYLARNQGKLLVGEISMPFCERHNSPFLSGTPCCAGGRAPFAAELVALHGGDWGSSDGWIGLLFGLFSVKGLFEFLLLDDIVKKVPAVEVLLLDAPRNRIDSQAASQPAADALCILGRVPD